MRLPNCKLNLKGKGIKNMLFIIAIGFLTSCSDISTKLENQLIELDTKTERLDSLINSKIDEVIELDTLISSENFRIKKLDSLMERNTLKIDSVAKEKIQLLNEILK